MAYFRYLLSNPTLTRSRPSFMYEYSEPARVPESQPHSCPSLICLVEEDEESAFDGLFIAIDPTAVARIGPPDHPVPAPFHWPANCPYAPAATSTHTCDSSGNLRVDVLATILPDQPKSHNKEASYDDQPSGTSSAYNPLDNFFRYVSSSSYQDSLQRSNLNKTYVLGLDTALGITPASTTALVITPVSVPEPDLPAFSAPAANARIANAPAPAAPPPTAAASSLTPVPSGSTPGRPRVDSAATTPPRQRDLPSDEELRREYLSRNSRSYQGPDLSLNIPSAQGATPRAGLWRVEIINGQRVFNAAPAPPPREALEEPTGDVPPPPSLPEDEN